MPDCSWELVSRDASFALPFSGVNSGDTGKVGSVGKFVNTECVRNEDLLH